MPLSPLAELVLQPVLELAIQVLGFFTARVLVPLFTLGLVHVEPGPHKKPVKPKFGRIQRQEGLLVMDAELGALMGIIFWFAIGIGAFLLVGRS